jgi:hypothetical protein
MKSGASYIKYKFFLNEEKTIDGKFSLNENQVVDITIEDKIVAKIIDKKEIEF